jgi:preprotein translocase subunit SecG
LREIGFLPQNVRFFHIMATLLIVLAFIALILLCGFMVLVILMQKASQGAGLGGAVGGGAAESAFGGEASNVLTKITIYCAIIFFLGSMGLSLMILYRHNHANSSAISDELKRLESIGGNVNSEVQPVAETAVVEEATKAAAESVAAGVEEVAKTVEEKVDAAADKVTEKVEQAVESVKEELEKPAVPNVNAEEQPVPGK